MRGWQVKLCDPLTTRAILQRFCGEALSSVLYLYPGQHPQNDVPVALDVHSPIIT